MQFSTLFLISLFSVSIALSGCVGSDNSSAPTKPNQPTNPETNNPNDNTDDDNSSGGDGDNGGNDSGGSSGGDNNAGNDGSGGNGSGDGSTGGNTTPDPVSCNAPETSITDTSFGDVGDVTKYDIDDYTALTGTTSLKGTWVVIGSQSAAGTSLNNPSINIRQKYFLVIKAISGDKYEVANCSGKVINEDLTVCVDDEKKEVSCETGGREISVGKDYKVWNGYLNKTVDTETNTINIPVSLAGELDFEIITNAYLTTADKKYSAIKISDATDNLGMLDLTSSKQNQTTKKVYYKKLTEQELADYKAGNKFKDIEPLKNSDINSYDHIDLPTETNKTLKQSSVYNDKELTCISQQVLHTRQCTTKNSETTNTSTLAAISATSTESYHLLFAAEQDADNNLLTVQNLVVKSGKTTETADAGTTLTVYDNIGFAKNETDYAVDMQLEFTAETLIKDTDKSYQTGFKAMCSPTEDDFLSSSGGSCDDKNKALYKTLLETTFTIVERNAKVKLAPDPARVN